MEKKPFLSDAGAIDKYKDLLHMEYPFKGRDMSRHPRMRIEDRAKIFMPFAALRGYEEAIAAKERIVVPRVELSEESNEYLDLQLARIEQELLQGQHPVITVVYFQKDKDSPLDGGEYIRFTGMVARFDKTARILQIVDKRLRLEDIYRIEGETLSE